MKSDIKNRLEELETTADDWAGKLPTVDYLGLDDYADGSWEELHHDQIITVLRNKKTGEIRGVYNNRRTNDEIEAAGGDLAYC